MMTSSDHKILHIDIETYSSVDLQECGVYAYAESSDFELLLLGYRYGDQDINDVTVLDLANINPDVIPQSLINDILSDEITKVAHNATFERVCLSRYFRDLFIIEGYLDPTKWFCTANRAAELGLPRSLEGAGANLGLAPEEAKMASVGKALIRYFCKPCAPTKANGGRTRNYPWHDIEKWNLFKSYNKRDVVAESVIYDKEMTYPLTIANERSLYALDQRINDLGVAVDMAFVDKILTYSDRHTANLLARAKEITGCDNPNSLSQIKEWLARRGLTVTSLSKDTIDDIAKSTSDQLVLEYLEIRKELGKTSVAKYEAMKRAAVYDEKTETYRVHGMLMFYGAMRTGRWAGRIVQLQNLPKNKYEDLDIAREMVMNEDFELLEMCYGNIMDVFSQLIRTAFIPSKGHVFVVADYNAIEARVIAWFADEQWKIDMFNRGGKVYEETASRMFHISVKDITHDSPERAKGKVAELAGGYGGGVEAYKRFGAEQFGWSDNEIKRLVKQWRDANSQIVKLWTVIENGAIKALSSPGSEIHTPHGTSFQQKYDTLFLKLPCGRKLAYKEAELDQGQYRMELSYMGENATTNKFERLRSYGGKLVENLVQATARDCLAEAMLRLDKNGYKVQFHVHDEVIIEVPTDEANEHEKRITDIMAIKDCMWKEGLPLRAESYTCPYYIKK